jgi:hypothetical protein
VVQDRAENLVKEMSPLPKYERNAWAMENKRRTRRGETQNVRSVYNGNERGRTVEGNAPK